MSIQSVTVKGQRHMTLHKIEIEMTLRGNLQGWQPRVVWIGIGGCIFFAALEEAKKVFVPQAEPAQQAH